MGYGGSWNSNNNGVTDYESAVQFLSRGRKDVNCRTLQHKTILRRNEDGSIAVQYHDTDVVTYHEDGSVTFDSGGWKTQTTKKRMNNYTYDGAVWSAYGVWYVKGGHVFDDGVKLLPDGSLEYPHEEPDAKDVTARRKQINKYAKEFGDNAFGLGQPDGGDCWICRLNDDSNGHLISHMEENYFVPTLAVNAMKESWFSDYYLNDLYGVLQGVYRPHYNMNWIIKQSVRRYILKRFGLSF